LLAVRHGQVDILIALLVTWDLTTARTPGRRSIPLGVATGLAAAIKLTPLIFIPYLLLTRRFKAARNCAVTFAAAGAIAFAVAPGSSKAYWTTYLLDYKRAGGSPGLQALFAPTNQSLLAALGRLSHGPVPAGLEWAAAGVIAAAGVLLAACVHARWSPFLGLMLCATTGLLISPVTWTHHMIWALPVIIWLGTAPGRPRWGRPAAAASAVLFWASPIWWVPGHGAAPLHESGWQLLAGDSFFFWMILLLAACAVSVPRRAPRRASSILNVPRCPDTAPLSAVSCSNGSMNDRARISSPQTRQTASTG
jgi:alpha-1,2-mannosyltransferase